MVLPDRIELRRQSRLVLILLFFSVSDPLLCGTRVRRPRRIEYHIRLKVVTLELLVKPPCSACAIKINALLGRDRLVRLEYSRCPWRSRYSIGATAEFDRNESIAVKRRT